MMTVIQEQSNDPEKEFLKTRKFLKNLDMNRI